MANLFTDRRGGQHQLKTITGFMTHTERLFPTMEVVLLAGMEPLEVPLWGAVLASELVYTQGGFTSLQWQDQAAGDAVLLIGLGQAKYAAHYVANHLVDIEVLVDEWTISLHGEALVSTREFRMLTALTCATRHYLQALYPDHLQEHYGYERQYQWFVGAVLVGQIQRMWVPL